VRSPRCCSARSRTASRHLTVSRVKVSRDLAHAKIYVMTLDEGPSAQEAWRALRRAAGFLRSGVARRLMMRSVPELHFVGDTSLADGKPPGGPDRGRRHGRRRQRGGTRKGR